MYFELLKKVDMNLDGESKTLLLFSYLFETSDTLVVTLNKYAPDAKSSMG